MVDEYVAGDGAEQYQHEASRYAKAELNPPAKTEFCAVRHTHQVIRPRCNAGNHYIGKKRNPIHSQILLPHTV